MLPEAAAHFICTSVIPTCTHYTWVFTPSEARHGGYVAMHNQQARAESKKIAFEIIEEVDTTDTAQAEVCTDPVSCSAQLKRKRFGQQAQK